MVSKSQYSLAGTVAVFTRQLSGRKQFIRLQQDNEILKNIGRMKYCCYFCFPKSLYLFFHRKADRNNISK